MNKDVELRSLSVNCSTSDRTIEGFAIISSSLSEDLGGFREIIEPEALEGLVERCDIKCYYNHQPESGVLARSRFGVGSLALNVEDGKLHFRFDSPNTLIGDYVLEGIRRKDFDQCSFGFICGEDTWEKVNGEYIRHIKSFKKVTEISIVPDPAYAATSASCRSFDAFKEAELKELEEQKEKEERANELVNYFNQLRDLLK